MAEQNADIEQFKVLSEQIIRYEADASQVLRPILWLWAAPRPVLVVVSFILVYRG